MPLEVSLSFLQRLLNMADVLGKQRNSDWLTDKAIHERAFLPKITIIDIYLKPLKLE